jgi:hypothetical protein
MVIIILILIVFSLETTPAGITTIYTAGPVTMTTHLLRPGYQNLPFRVAKTASGTFTVLTGDFNIFRFCTSHQRIL